MKAKKKFSFGPNGLKGFFFEHVEKIVLFGTLVLVLMFIYLGTTVETYPSDKDPDALKRRIELARNNVNAPTWANVAPELEPQPINNPIVIRTRPDDFPLAAIDPPIQPSRQKRRDPDLYPPQQLEVVAIGGAAISVLQEEEAEELAPIDEKWRLQQEEASRPIVPVEEPDDRKKKKRRTQRDDDLLGNVSPRGSTGPAGARMLTDDEREELQKLGVRPTSTAIPVSRNIVALKAVIPFKKQMAEYLDALAGNPSYFSPERDMPKYVFFYVERADVTENPDADPATLQWQLLSTKNAQLLPYVEGAQWDPIPEELIDPAAVDSLTTLPVPPALLVDLKQLAGHSEIDWAATIEREAAEEARNADPNRPIATDPEGPEGPELPSIDGPDSGRPGTTPTVRPGVRPGGPVRPAAPMGREGGRAPVRNPYARVGRAGGSDLTSAQQVTYKMLRFIDFDVERGRKYRYRVRLMLEDPNHPMPSVGGPNNGRGEGNMAGNDPLPASLNKDVEQRLRELRKQEEKTGKRIWYRNTDWSEPSPVVTVPEPMTVAVGTVTPARKLTVPGTVTEVEMSEPEAKAMVVQWDDYFAVNVAAEHDVSRGSYMNFVKEGEALHPIKLEFVKLKDYQFATGATVVDLRGGEKLPGPKEYPLTAPSRLALIDEHGQLIVQNEADDLAIWHRYGEIEIKQEEPEEQTDRGREGEPYRDLLVPGSRRTRGRR